MTQFKKTGELKKEIEQEIARFLHHKVTEFEDKTGLLVVDIEVERIDISTMALREFTQGEVSMKVA